MNRTGRRPGRRNTSGECHHICPRKGSEAMGLAQGEPTWLGRVASMRLNDVGLTFLLRQRSQALETLFRRGALSEPSSIRRVGGSRDHVMREDREWELEWEGDREEVRQSIAQWKSEARRRSDSSVPTSPRSDMEIIQGREYLYLGSCYISALNVYLYFYSGIHRIYVCRLRHCINCRRSFRSPRSPHRSSRNSQQ